ncbi:MAG: hypothetical protein F2663_05950 [Actinobacteria bacterium]|uniref:L-threonylcarbamoyladenylate synthase n=1 Tax=freshwater metagenome TaxID=449393 RepID=A0A6J6PP76_9ZZZZ|nr:hypothetical protein [Actinomycetota bacterium]
MDAVGVQDAVAALRRSEAVLLPADGVYGMCALASDKSAVLALYALKGREARQPTAVIAPSIKSLLAFLPDIPAHERLAIERLLPGPFTLVVSNPASRYPWLSGDRSATLGVRVANLPGSSQAVLDAVGPVAATSANEPGEPPAASLSDVTARIRAGCGAEVDAGALPGTPSTVVDITSTPPLVLREGLVSAAETLALLAS